MLALPANGPFREVTDLLNVKGMTPEIYAAANPYLTTRGAATINLNTAPSPVLRILPGMSDAILSRIISLRSQGRRIQSVQEVMSASRRGRPVGAAGAQETQRLASRASVVTNQISLTIVVRSAPQAQPVRLLAILQRSVNGNQSYASVQFREW